ncbi:stress response serine/threonine protein kinase YihE [Xenophilus sp. AP218F]|nr:serine/threonine protein kinase [Chromobacterium sp. ASV5]OWY39160.1 stress response serine/threonine protein kinase YihE [Xenophilus sp. AP218F]
MENLDAAPFGALTPDTLLDAVESLGLYANGSLLALNSYENRVYQVGLEDAAPVVAKFYRPERWSDAQILEEHAFSQALAEREIPVVAPLAFDGATLHRHGGYRFALFPRRGGRVPELGDARALEWIGRFLGRIHALGRVADYAHRPALDIDSFGGEPVAFLLEQQWLPTELREVYRGVAAQALDGVARCFDRAGDVASLRLHGDCHVGNMLWTDDGPHFVDFDDSRTGPAVQDLWMLLSGSREEQSRQLSDVLSGYEDFCEFDMRELHLVEALRTLRLLHYSAWLARRWNDPAFPAAFPWFAGQRYWEEQILTLREQVALLDEPPLWSA